MEPDLSKVSSLRSDKTGATDLTQAAKLESSQISELGSRITSNERLLEHIKSAEDKRRDLNYALFDVAIITERETRLIKICYETLINYLRRAISTPFFKDKKQIFYQKMCLYCSEFGELVDKRILPFYWVSVHIKANLMRIKADFLRYLLEADIKNSQHQLDAHKAYSEAKLFFINNHLSKTSEWFRLRLNYAGLLYLDGSPTASLYICKRLLKSSKIRTLEGDLVKRAKRNIRFFKQICMH